MKELEGLIPLWHFLQALQKQLGYSCSIDKYKLIAGLLYNPDNTALPDVNAFYGTCKALCLQNKQDEGRFREIFGHAWQKEMQVIENLLKRNIAENSRPIEGHKPTPSSEDNTQNKTQNEPKQKTTPPKSIVEQTDKILHEKEPATEYYYTPPTLSNIDMGSGGEGENHIVQAFNLDDEYLPITRREMNKGWQYLRQTERGRPTNEIDINRTVQKIASEGMFTTPVFISGKKNRQNSLILFVDRNGSMAPFTAMGQRLVEAAKNYGGHQNATIFYFQNYPRTHLFLKSNLSKPIKMADAFAKTSSQYTTAVIISDAGFARSGGHSGRYTIRQQGLKPLFALLDKHVANTLWLNPMPANRWEEKTKAFIEQNGHVMYPLQENQVRTGVKGNLLQNIIVNFFKKHAF